MSYPDWFLVANASRAQVFAREADAPLQLVRSFEHPSSRQRTAALGDGKAGRELSGHGFGGAAFEPRTDAHRKEHLHFAHEIAAFLEHEAQAHSFGSITLFAPDPFLGELKRELGAACTRLLSAAEPLDLSRVPQHELAARIGKALGAA